jgi:hypothetical protein
MSTVGWLERNICREQRQYMDQWDLTGYYYGASGFVGSIQDY